MHSGRNTPPRVRIHTHIDTHYKTPAVENIMAPLLLQTTRVPTYKSKRLHLVAAYRKGSAVHCRTWRGHRTWCVPCVLPIDPLAVRSTELTPSAGNFARRDSTRNIFVTCFSLAVCYHSFGFGRYVGDSAKRGHVGMPGCPCSLHSRVLGGSRPSTAYRDADVTS